jgi:hypothetical protein
MMSTFRAGRTVGKMSCCSGVFTADSAPRAQGPKMTALQQLVERNCRRAELLAVAARNRTGRLHTHGTQR